MAEYGELQFPISYRVYQGEHTSTPAILGLDLLEEVSDFIERHFQICVLADSGFEAAVFLEGVQRLGFEFVVVGRSNRRTVHPGRVTVAHRLHGGDVNLANCPWANDLNDWIGRSVRVGDYRLFPRNVSFKGQRGSRAKASVGTVTFQIARPGDGGPIFARLLTNYAAYSGVGYKTTYSLGHDRPSILTDF